MATIAELKVIVDASQIDKAKESLKSFNDAADKVQTSSSKISSGMKDASGGSAEFSGAAERLIARVKELEATVGMSKGGVLSYKATLLGVNDVVKPLASSFDSLTASQKNNDAISKEIARSQALADAEKHKMLESLKEEITLYGKSKSEIQLYRAEQLGIIDSVRPLVEELNRLKEAKEGADKAGKSGGEGLTKKQQELELLRQEGQAIQENLNHLKNTNAIEADRARIKAEFAANQAKYESKKIEIEEVLALRDAEKTLADAKAGSKRATTDELNEFKKFRGEVDPTKKSLEKYYDQLAKIQQLRSQKKKGVAAGVDLEELNQLETVVNRNIKTLENYGATTGKTAKEIAFSMRGLPAQFTDIAVSLQGGQKPLTVFLQQGGQLKDMFGGIVPALRAMGGYVMSLVTPFNVLGATFAGLAYLAYSGSKETSAFNRTLFITGQQAKITANELSSMSSGLSNSYTTIGYAAEVLNKVVASGNIHKDNLESVTRATLDWSKATGASVDDIISDFSSLAKDPVRAISELQDKYKYLTQETYEAAKAQLEMGKNTEATRILTEQLSTTIQNRSSVIIASLNPIEMTLFRMKENAKGIVDWFKEIGRSDVTKSTAATFHTRYLETLDEIDDKQKELDRTRDTFNRKRISREIDKLKLQAENNAKLYQASMDLLIQSEKQPFLDASMDLDERHLATKKESQRLTLEMNQAQEKFDELKKKGLVTDEQIKKNEEIILGFKSKIYDLEKKESGENLIDAAKDRRDLAAEEFGFATKIGAKQKEYIVKQQELAELQEKVDSGRATSAEKLEVITRNSALLHYKEAAEMEKKWLAEKSAASESKKNSVIKNSAAETLLTRYKAQEEVLREQLSSEEKLGVEAKNLIRLKEELDGIEVKARTTKLSLDEQSKLNARDALLSQQLKNKSLEDEIIAKAKVVELERYNIGLQKELDAGRQRIEDLKNSSGKGDREVSRAKELNSIRLEGARAVRELEVNEKGKEGFDEKLAALQQFNEERLAQTLAMHEAENEMQSNAIGGLQAGWATFLESNLDIYATMKDASLDVFGTLQSGIRDSLVQSIMYGDSLRESFAKLGLVIQEKVLGALIDVGLQFAINASREALGLTTAAATKKTVEASATAASLASMSVSTAAAVASGAAITAAYTPAAIAASIASFGGAAVSATASIATQTPIMAASIASTKLAGFREGGYTGNKGVDDIAGVVHGREFVFDAESTSRIGVNNLEKIRSGKTGGGDTIISTNISVTAEAGMSESDARAQGEAAAEGFETRVLSIIANQRRAGGMLSTS